MFALYVFPNPKKGLRSSVISFARMTDRVPAAIPLNLAEIRLILDRTTPVWAKISRKRKSNLRSALAAAIRASELCPMLRTAGLSVDSVWTPLLAPADPAVRHGLSRFVRWASLRQVRPQAVNDTVIARCIAEFHETTLIGSLHTLHGTIARAWNALTRLHPEARLRRVTVPSSRPAHKRIPWHRLPASLRKDVERYLAWAAVPDPLADGARARALSPQTLRLQQGHVLSALAGAVAAGISLERITSLAKLVEPEVVRAILRHRWREDGSNLSAYTHGLTVTLIAVAKDWVKAPEKKIAELKVLLSKLGSLPTGLTEKNKALLRTLDDPRLLDDLIKLPDRMWHVARRALPNSKRAFIDLQSALMIDILLHAPLRPQNLAALNFTQTSALAAGVSQARPRYNLWPGNQK